MRLPDLSRWLGRRRGPTLSRGEQMALRPVRNPVIEWSVQEDGRVVLTVPVVHKPWMRLINLLAPAPATRGVQLDEVGSDVWQWCDGETEVAELVKRLARTHRLNAREAEVSLTKFLDTLARRRFVGWRPEEVPESEKAKGVSMSNRAHGKTNRS